jgi:hypothetical protein
MLKQTSSMLATRARPPGMSVPPNRLGRCAGHEYCRPTLDLVSPMPQPGDPCPGFIAQPGRCWQMIYSRQLQATHCDEPPSWTGRWFTPRGDRWFRVWACSDHLDGLTGLREFDRRRS